MIGDEKAFRKVIVLGAGGKLGALLARKLSEHSSSILWFDRVPSCGVAEGDAILPGPVLGSELADADLVVLALPGEAICTALPGIMRLVPDEALIVETASAKSTVAAVLPDDRPYVEVIGINPMFAPSMDFSGQTVVVVPYAARSGIHRLKKLLFDWGANVVVADAVRHDRLTAIVQGATHAAILGFGEALWRSGCAHETFEIATPPFRALVLLLARLLSGSSEVYWDIQAANPFAADARKAVEAGIARCDALVASHDMAGFAGWFAQLAEPLAPRLPEFKQRSEVLLATIEGIGRKDRC